MSQQPINRSPDLLRLREESYAIELREGYLLVRDVPYVNAQAQVRRGTLICEMQLAGDVAQRPANHAAKWSGEHPCHYDGAKLSKIEHSSSRERLFADVYSDHTFSAKPKGRPAESYSDFYDKVTSYIAIISGPAEHLQPGVTARTHYMSEAPADSVFQYTDTASSRSGIVAISEKLKMGKVAIVGVGGTGSYVLDLVAKTPVKEIHLFDNDVFLQHNAFRAPGAPTREALEAAPRKAAYFRDLYSNMHRGVVAHEKYIDADTVEGLREMEFVFVCIDQGEPKKIIATKLHEWNIPFIDAGLGVFKAGDSLGGIVRVTTSSLDKRDHLDRHVSYGGGDPNADYSQAIQIADLNALTATLAVIKWKKLIGFYLDLEREHHSTYTVDGNLLLNEEQACRA